MIEFALLFWVKWVFVLESFMDEIALFVLIVAYGIDNGS